MTLPTKDIPREHMTHCGDGVYALYDGYGIWLHANSHDQPTDRIYLEPEVFDALLQFAKRMNEGK